MAAAADSDFDQLCVNTIRCLAADTVDKAKSGHPGMPMGMAPIAHVLWTKFMNYNPSNPKWFNRDRFVLSNGHGCSLLYIMMHLTGGHLTMDDLKNFRQLNSKCPGHPESHLTEGVEVTTGPLGQGVANSVGLAIAAKHLATEFNKPNFNLINNKTWVFTGDGCLQEGISGEAASLAGHLGLDNLVWIYDDNKITIDGDTALSFTEDVSARFRAYGWHTITVENGDTDLASIEAALHEANVTVGKPILISVRTSIGYGSARAGTSKAHGEPLGPKLTEEVKKKFGFDPATLFHVPENVKEFYLNQKTIGHAKEQAWQDMFTAYSKEFPELAAEFTRRFTGQLPADWKSALPTFTPADAAKATRQLSAEVLNALAKKCPEIMGGSADLTPSNLTDIKGAKDFQKDTYDGRYLRFGVREHAMAAIGNGMAAYGALIPYTATFLVFITYAFPAVRLSALSGLRQIYIMTHDSIGLGEDGPTHQPIEALAMCRATPNILVLRPADGNEVSGSYAVAMENAHGPSVLALTRQAVPHLAGSSAAGVAKGAYVMAEIGNGNVELVYVASGSEVSLAIKAAELYSAANGGKKIRIVSMPSQELFERQPADYRRSVIPVGVPTISLEALTVYGWSSFAHYNLGMRTFGISAPGPVVYDYFGFTPEKISASTTAYLQHHAAESAAMQAPATFPALPIHFAALPAAKL